MKVFVTGVGGQLGYDVTKEILRRGYKGVGSDLAQSVEGFEEELASAQMEYIPLDITDAQAVQRVLAAAAPDVVVHCAAWTAVDLAEENEERVRAINVGGTENIAKACKVLNCKMVYISTDYIFDGQGTTPWKPDCDAYQPLNVYGMTKLEGERAVAANLEKYFIVRIAWAFGRNGNNFVKTMLRLSEKYDTIRVVNDQIGTPTYTYDLAGLLADMIETDRYGIYHATNEGGFISWFAFASEIFRQAGKNTTVISVTTEEYGMSKARRPMNSRMDKSKLTEAGFSRLPDWKDALSRYLKEIGVSNGTN